MTGVYRRPADIDVAKLFRDIATIMERDDIGSNELARRAGLSPGYVSMILSGQRDRTLAKGLLFAHAVGLAHLDSI